MPIVHWIRDGELRSRAMAALARFGFKRKYRDEMEFRGWSNVGEFARIYSEVIGTMTNYKSEREIKQIAREEGLEASFPFTSQFFTTKLQTMMNRAPGDYGRPGWLDAVGLPLLKRASSITLCLRSL